MFMPAARFEQEAGTYVDANGKTVKAMKSLGRIEVVLPNVYEEKDGPAVDLITGKTIKVRELVGEGGHIAAPRSTYLVSDGGKFRVVGVEAFEREYKRA